MATHLPAPVLRKEIRRILKGEDLEKITPKIVRLRLEKKYSVDLVERKQEISQICKQVIDTLSESSESEEDEPLLSRQASAPQALAAPQHHGRTEPRHDEPAAAVVAQTQDRVGGGRVSASDSGSDSSSTAGSDSDDDADTNTKHGKATAKKVNGNTKLSNSLSSSSSPPSSPPRPPKKKTKADVQPRRTTNPSPSPSRDDSDNSDVERQLDDEELARRLQEQERPIRAAARHLVNKDLAKPKRNAKEKKPRKQSGEPSGYMKMCLLSDELAQLMGTERMARHQVVKRMHEIIKERNLRDPRNKQFHICDSDLLPIFGKKRVRTFGMMKYLNKHINSE